MDDHPTMADVGPVRTLEDFYGLMMWTRDIRARLVHQVLTDGVSVAPADVDRLTRALSALEEVPSAGGSYQLQIGDETTELDLGYEIEELERDILFLSAGEPALLERLVSQHEDFRKQVEEGVDRFGGRHYRVFASDRDGTVNNYCGRYASSIQSVYNAVFITRFARARCRHAVILTSAPLANVGLVDISVTPTGVVTYAGSKGRQYLGSDGEEHTFPIETHKQDQLDRLNEALTRIVETPDYEVYARIGSGLQFKFGQTTIARQDVSRSIPEAESQAFLNLLKQRVRELDPDGRYFRIEDTGLDVEIILTVDSGQRDFDKGDGLRFLDEDLRLGLGEGPNLVCGDTRSDLPMAVAATDLSPDTDVIFVTEDDDLAASVRDVSSSALIVRAPDVLVTILNELARS